MNRPAFRASLIALAAAAPAPLWAQEEAPTSEEIVVTAQGENATEVVNGGNAGVLGNKPALDLPFTIRTYDESLILNQQPQTLGDVLDNDPTIRTSYGFGNAAELFVIRGFPLFSDDIGVNGLYGIAPRQVVAPELLGSVQVLNGSSAFLNGAAPGGTGLGGSVNLTLKRASARDFLRATAGFEETARFGGSLDLSRRFGDSRAVGVRVNGAWREGETAVDREDRRTRVIGGGFDYDGGAFRAALDIAFQDIRIDRLRPKVTIASGAIPRVPEADANYAQDFTYTELRDVFGTLSLEYDIADNAMLYARGGARDGREEGVYSSITVNDAVTGAATGGGLFVPATTNNEAIEAGLRVKLGSAITQEINFGGNVNWQVFRTAFDFGSSFATNLYDTPQVARPGPGFVGGDLTDPNPTSESRLASAFVSDTIGFFGDRVLLTGGLRLQDIRQINTNYNGTPGETYDESAITPVVALVVKPSERLSLYANRIEALQQGPTAPIDPALNITNPGEVLAPRTSVQYEVGGKLELGEMFLGLGVYRIQRPGEGLLPDRSFGYVGDQRHQGIEFTANGNLAPGLRLIAGAALTDAELIAGNKVPGVPEWTANADVEWDLPFASGITLTGRVVHTGEQWVDTANTLELDSWTRFDVGARYVFATGDVPVTLRLSVDNVANERYWASAFDSFSAALLQGAPRTVRASISADF